MITLLLTIAFVCRPKQIGGDIYAVCACICGFFDLCAAIIIAGIISS